ncbi:MAG: hypothetical protein PGN26_10415 [Xylophilus ampelinus]
MLFAILLLVAFAVFAFDSLMVTIVHRQALGKFAVVSDWGRMLAFESATGSFRVRSDLRRLEYAMNGIQGAMDFAEIALLEHAVIPKDADLGQFLLDPGMDEHWRDERDSIDWHVISAVGAGGEKIPLFRSGRYHRRKHLHGLYTELQVGLLQSLGLLVDVEAQCRDILERLRSRMQHPRIVHARD